MHLIYGIALSTILTIDGMNVKIVLTNGGNMNVKYRLKDGFTKDQVMAQIKAKNHGYAAGNSGVCYYRQDINGETNCCLVGAFIPDELYSEAMEDKGADDVINEFSLEDYMPLSNDGMLELQRFHDNDLNTKTIDKPLFYSKIEQWLNENVI